jgi:NTE family protein
MERNGCLYSDGGPIANTPIEACRKMGADLVIAVYLPATLKREEKFANGLEVILRVDLIASAKLGRTLLGQADIVISPEVGDIHWAAFKKLDDCIDLGVKAAEKVLPEIIVKLKAQRSPFSRLRHYIRSKLTQD